MRLLLSGAWTGPVGDPDRLFSGVLTSGELDDLTPGAPVEVSFRVPPGRLQGAGEHGHYCLAAAGREWRVSHFARSDVSDAGTRDEAREQVWVAELGSADPM